MLFLSLLPVLYSLNETSKTNQPGCEFKVSEVTSLCVCEFGRGCSALPSGGMYKYKEERLIDLVIMDL